MPQGERIAHTTSLPAWAARMDELTAAGIPYLFILDFDLTVPVILPLEEEALSGIRYKMQTQALTPPSHHRGGETILPVEHVTHLHTHATHPAVQRDLRSAPASQLIPLYSGTSRLTKTPVSFETYAQGFHSVMRAIRAGDTYLLNLCYATRITGIPGLEEIFDRVQAPYKLYVPGRFVLFSPEQFVAIRDGMIRTFPMKGTIDASLPDAEKELLDNIKEKEEHATVVDLLRNDLSIVAGHVHVDRYRFITEIRTPEKTLLQCSSEISGVLQDEYANRFGSLMHALLPAGSVTGAPKKKTVEIIRTVEPEPRGYYTGVFGVFDGVSLDSAVMIRMIEKRADGYYYRSGGGITYRSDARQEYEEMVQKVYLPV